MKTIFTLISTLFFIYCSAQELEDKNKNLKTDVESIIQKTFCKSVDMDIYDFKDHFIQCVRHVERESEERFDEISWDITIPAYYPDLEDLKLKKDSEKMKSVMDYSKYNPIGTIVVGYLDGKPYVAYEACGTIDLKMNPECKECPYQFEIIKGDFLLKLVDSIKKVKKKAKKNEVIRIIVDGYYTFGYRQNKKVVIYRMKRDGLHIGSEEKITEIVRKKLKIMKTKPNEIFLW